MKTNLSRRKLLTAGLATAGGSGLGVAARLADRYGLIPPDHGGLYGPGKTLTYASQRLVTPSPARACVRREALGESLSSLMFDGGQPTFQALWRKRQAIRVGGRRGAPPSAIAVSQAP
jgi:hypothetical protein